VNKNKAVINKQGSFFTGVLSAALAATLIIIYAQPQVTMQYFCIISKTFIDFLETIYSHLSQK